MKLSVESTKYTSFVTTVRQYVFLCMSFGLCNAPAMCTRFLKSVFKDLIVSDKIVFYMDDTYEEHLSILRDVLRKLIATNLELKNSKCKFFMNEIFYLGYTVTQN